MDYENMTPEELREVIDKQNIKIKKISAVKEVPVSVKKGTYKGIETLSLLGSWRPICHSVNKWKRIIENLELIKAQIPQE